MADGMDTTVDAIGVHQLGTTVSLSNVDHVTTEDATEPNWREGWADTRVGQDFSEGPELRIVNHGEDVEVERSVDYGAMNTVVDNKTLFKGEPGSIPNIKPVTLMEQELNGGVSNLNKPYSEGEEYDADVLNGGTRGYADVAARRALGMPNPE